MKNRIWGQLCCLMTVVLSVVLGLCPVAAQTPTPLPLLDTYHLPVEMLPDPPATTMRDPLNPEYSENVNIYAGVPVAAVINSAQLLYRVNGSGVWLAVNLDPFSVHGSTGYRHGQISLSIGDLFVDYYVKVASTGYQTTYVYGDDNSYSRTADEDTARINAFAFSINYPTPGTPTPSPSYTPEPGTITPSPTATVTPQVPTPTPTPSTDFALQIYMEDTYLQDGDHCLVLDMLYNRTAHDELINLFFILEVYGSYYFFPSWSQQIDFVPMTLNSNSQPFTYVILDFPWSDEENYPPTFGLVFWSAMMDEQVSMVLGNIDYLEFGYGPA